jgi:regulatory protein
MAGRKARPPLNAEKLNDLALAYVGRFATTRSKLIDYLKRKVRERGWVGERAADPEAIAGKLCDLGYVDDAAFALSKARSLTARGYGARRVRQSLHAAGIGDKDRSGADALVAGEAVQSALRFASRRRIGPYSDRVADRAQNQRALAAMIRAGHPFELSKAIVALEPGAEVDIETLAEKA